MCLLCGLEEPALPCPALPSPRHPSPALIFGRFQLLRGTRGGRNLRRFFPLARALPSVLRREKSAYVYE